MSSGLVGLFLLHIAVAAVLTVREEGRAIEWAYGMALGSLLLVSSVYLTAHWALRPERFVPAGLVRLTDPLTPLLAKYLRSSRARRLRRSRRARQDSRSLTARRRS